MAARTTTALAPSVLDSFRRGEDSGVREVYLAYNGPVFAVAWSVLGDRELAVEAVQETFVRAWRAAARYDPTQDIAPWLFTIARRVSVDIWRSRRRMPTTELEETSAVVAGPELDSMWEAYQVRAAVDRLPEEERDVVRLAHFGQRSHAEIAAELGIPIGTVKSRSHRAHRRLAGWLRPLCVVSPEGAEGPSGVLGVPGGTGVTGAPGGTGVTGAPGGPGGPGVPGAVREPTDPSAAYQPYSDPGARHDEP